MVWGLRKTVCPLSSQLRLLQVWTKEISHLIKRTLHNYRSYTSFQSRTLGGSLGKSQELIKQKLYCSLCDHSLFLSIHLQQINFN